MERTIDLTGQVFGRLRVVKRESNLFYPYRDTIKFRVQWLCECICGNQVTVLAAHLRNGNSTSCGCYTKERAREANFIDLTGRKFGRLFVVKEDHVKRGRTYWLCKCECGNQTIVLGSSLKAGATKSCGCYSRERASERGRHLKNLVGLNFGRLTVIERAEDYVQPNGKHCAKWLCQCSCGNQVAVSAGNLKKRTANSCGCLTESSIASEVKQYFVDNYGAVLEYKILRNPGTRRWLRFDIYIPNGIFIEIHGKQHYEFNEHFYKKEGEFAYRKDLDTIKRRYAEQNGIYIEVDLRVIVSAESAISYIYRMASSRQS